MVAAPRTRFYAIIIKPSTVLQGILQSIAAIMRV